MNDLTAACKMLHQLCPRLLRVPLEYDLATGVWTVEVRNGDIPGHYIKPATGATALEAVHAAILAQGELRALWVVSARERLDAMEKELAEADKIIAEIG